VLLFLSSLPVIGNSDIRQAIWKHNLHDSATLDIMYRLGLSFFGGLSFLIAAALVVRGGIMPLSFCVLLNVSAIAVFLSGGPTDLIVVFPLSVSLLCLLTNYVMLRRISVRREA
jgi:hypothetical protein